MDWSYEKMTHVVVVCLWTLPRVTQGLIFCSAIVFSRGF